LTVDALDAHGERFFTRLLMKVDDYGRTLADNRLLKSRLYPLKTDIRETDISRWLAACQKAGLIRFYVDGKGRTILEVFKFGQRKRFMKSAFDPPGDQQFLPLQRETGPILKKCPINTEVEVEGKGKADATPLKKNVREINTLPAGIAEKAESKNKRALWQLLSDEKSIKERLASERDSTKPDPELQAVFREQLKSVRDEIKNLKTP